MENCQFWGREFMSLSQNIVRSIKKVYENCPFSHDIILKQSYIVMLISFSLVNICQNYIGLFTVFLDPQYIVSQEEFQHKILSWSTLLPHLYLHTIRGSTVTGFEIILKQVFTTGVSVKTSKNFQNRYFLCNTSRRLLLKLY